MAWAAACRPCPRCVSSVRRRHADADVDYTFAQVLIDKRPRRLQRQLREHVVRHRPVRGRRGPGAEAARRGGYRAHPQHQHQEDHRLSLRHGRRGGGRRGRHGARRRSGDWRANPARVHGAGWRQDRQAAAHRQGGRHAGGRGARPRAGEPDRCRQSVRVCAGRGARRDCHRAAEQRSSRTPQLLGKLEAIRRAASVAMGIAPDLEKAGSLSVPLRGVRGAAPVAMRVLSGRRLAPAEWTSPCA